MAVDVSELEFEQEVIEASKDVPVVVDFWAPWCGPCRQLAPVLEAAVEARGEAVRLVKVNTDENPRIAQAYRIQGIPAVKAFRDGKVIDEFVGVQPRQAIDAFLDGLAPGAAELALAAGDETSLREALAAEPRHLELRLALGRLLLGAGRADDAVEVLRDAAHDTVGAGMLARAELVADPAADPEIAAALARYDGDAAGALDALIGLLAGADAERKDRIRNVMVGIFGERGNDDPLVPTYRKRLASALY